MPFPDEAFASGVRVVPHQSRWAEEGRALVERLHALVTEAVRVDHIGSTAVPGLAAKDCLDAMVQVSEVSMDLGSLVAAGFRERSEPWNRSEDVEGASYPKRVFAPPVGARAVNVHVRRHGSTPARYALLFRDFLRADPDARAEWGALKAQLATEVDDLAEYGRRKSEVLPALMTRAEAWATRTGWRPSD